MPPDLARHVVTAILVAHDGARWLPETLKALLTQTRPVDRLVAVDTGSGDAGPALLTEILGDGNLITLPRETGYAEAVATAVAHPAATLAVPLPDGVTAAERVEWIWLLHDDSAPAPDALERLLSTAESQPPAVILGPKLRDWDDRRVLVEAGVAIDRAGRRETGLDRREFDQGQHDTIREVMAVGTAGMLVRRDVWTELGGLDPAFGLFRDDVDFGWRAYAAGHRVLLAPDAVLYHAEAAARGRRAVTVPADDRRNALLVLLANLPRPALAAALPRLAAGTLLRALVRLLRGRPDAARAELAALCAAVLRAPRLRRTRTHGRGRGGVGRFQPRWPTLRRLPELLAGMRIRVPVSPRRWLRSPPVPMVLALTAVSVAAQRGVLAAAVHGGPGGGALVPAWGGASDLWTQYVSGWHPVGLGSAAGSPPYVGVLAVVSTVLLGKPWLAVLVLLLGTVPLAGLSAYAATRLIPRAGPLLRVWAAVTYALLPVATGAVTTGRLGTAVVIVLLPPIGYFARRMLAEDARHAAWAVAVPLAVATAFAPLTWILVAAAILLARYALGGDAPHFGRRAAIALAVPPLLLLPWTLHLPAHPSELLREAGPATAVARPAPGALVMLDPGGPGTPPAWITAGLMLTAVAALLLPRRRLAVLTGWLVALTGLPAAILTVARPAWPGVALVFAAAGTVLAASVIVRQAGTMAGRGLARRAGALVIVAAAAATPLLAAGAWTARGTHGPLGRVSAGAVPVSVTFRATRPRMLVLAQDPGGAVTVSVLRDRLPRAGEEALAAPAAARGRLRARVAGLVAGTTDATALARFGIRYVLVPHPDGDPLVRALDAAPGLTRLGRTHGFALWEVAAPTGRLMLVDGGTVTPLAAGPVGARVRIPPGGPGRTLLLAEPADGGWHATLGGRTLRPRTADGWAQAYDVPPEGGEFTLRRGMRLRHLWVTVQGMALVLTVLLALPSEPRPVRARHRRRRARPADPALSGAAR